VVPGPTGPLAPAERRLGAWAATALVVSEVVGVGIFLSPATMMRTLGSTAASLAVWAAMGGLSAAGALCYAELSTRFPRTGGAYVFLREGFGHRWAFVFGWMSVLVVDPGLTAALGLGLAQYSLAALGAPTTYASPVAIACIVTIGWLARRGLDLGARLLRWTAAAKLAMVALLVVAGIVEALTTGVSLASASAQRPDLAALAGAGMAAFFAFGGWWDVGRMSGEVASPRRTMPIALVGGIGLVTLIYAVVTMAFVLAAPAAVPQSDDALVAVVGAALFGAAAGRLLAAMVALAVGGSLVAVLLGAPRMYVAMARDGLLPGRFTWFDASRGSAPAGTVIQVVLACVLVLLGTFEQILGFFVPAAVFFLGLSAASLVVLPRPSRDTSVFRVPWYPLPLAVFLVLVVVMVTFFAAGQPRQTLAAGAIVLAGVGVSRIWQPE
jgi:basic amino acid/polyamine antiporter, APA family